jgi:hypothetical protein
MSIMAARNSRPRASPRSVTAVHNAAAGAALTKALSLMDRWPAAWQIDEGDLAYGEGLLEQFKPFVTYLVNVQQLAPTTLRRHLNDLFLLGGELISHINTFEKDRRLSPARLLDDNIWPDGGPLCRHVEEGPHQRHYDATCKKLHAFRSAASQTHKFR